MENFGIQKLAEELKRINPDIPIDFKIDRYPALIIAGCSDCSKLNIPEGYEYNGKSKLTNNHETVSDQDESFELITSHEYFTMLA